MSLAENLEAAFPSRNANEPVSNGRIRDGRGPMEEELEGPLINHVPAYLKYCVANEGEDSLVLMHTINAVAEYGRCKNPENGHLNFKFQCNKDQIHAVLEFLHWAMNQPSEDETQIARAIKNWRKALTEKQ